MFDEQEEIRTLLDCVAFNPTERAYANTIAAEWEDSLLSLVTHVKLSVRAGQSIVDHKEVK
jgi:hypothetical protein